jgi:hypothetical protein
VRAWLFQGNPKVWRIHDYLRDNPSEDFQDWSWSCTRYRDLVARGDRAVLWLSGDARARGVVATGHITGEPYDEISDSPYWTDPANRSRVRSHVPMALDRVFFDAPVLAADLRADPRFALSSILRQPRAANPHPLTQDAWRAIADRIPARAGMRRR